MGSAALKIRGDQVEALRAFYFEELEERTARILVQWFPAECERLGESGVRAFVRSSARRAEDLGAEREVDLGKYIAMELALGVTTMRELVASEQTRRRARGARESVSALIGAVCRAGLLKLAGKSDQPSDDDRDEEEA